MVGLLSTDLMPFAVSQWGTGGGLANLVTVSPRPRQVRVTWHRSSINVKPADGWRPDLVYHVVLAPGITDLRNNRMEQGFTVIFSRDAPGVLYSREALDITDLVIEKYNQKS